MDIYIHTHTSIQYFDRGSRGGPTCTIYLYIISVRGFGAVRVARPVPGPTWLPRRLKRRSRAGETSFQSQLGHSRAPKTPFQSQLGIARASKTPFQGQLGVARVSKTLKIPIFPKENQYFYNIANSASKRRSKANLALPGRPKRRSRANLAAPGRPKRRSRANLALPGRSKRRSRSNLALPGSPKRRSRANLVPSGLPKRRYRANLALSDRPKRRSRDNLAVQGHPTRRSRAKGSANATKCFKTSANTSRLRFQQTLLQLK